MKDDIKRRCLASVSAVLVAFAYMTVITQFVAEDSARQSAVSPIPTFARKVRQLARTTNMMDADAALDPFFGVCRALDLGLPPAARIYMDGVLGSTNRHRCLLYGYVVYYLFPREVATSLDQPAQITRDGFVGQPAQSPQELVAHGFDLAVVTGENTLEVRPLRDGIPAKPPASPDWFPSRRDAVIAFLLPLLAALAGLELMRLLFPTLHARTPLLERLGCGFGLAMMTVAAVTLGIKLCGFHGRGVMLAATGVGAMIAAWRNRKALLTGIPAGLGEAIQSPAAMVGGLMFLLVFGAAGVLGMFESDAVCAWMLKAKILHLHTGSELVRWFSEPRLAHAHLDYPPLMPALHCATFDSIGRVNEFVTKFWPAWMLLLLVGALAALNRGGSRRLAGPSFFLLALVLLPAMRLFTESEGGTMPMIFFTTLGLVQCALAQEERDRARLGLGLTLLWGAALVKFDGVMFLAAAGLWLLLLPAARAMILSPVAAEVTRLKALRTSERESEPPHVGCYSFKWLPRLPARGWLVVAFCLVAALPYFWLRVQIPALHDESHWARYALLQPGITLASMPAFLLMMTARWFVSLDLAAWSAEGGHLHWVGKWEGFSSLYHHPTLGLAWMAMFMTLALWLIHPARRKLIAWLLAVIASVLVGFSLVFASFASTAPLTQLLDFYTQEITSTRYLFPLLAAWSATVLTLLFRDPPS